MRRSRAKLVPQCVSTRVLFSSGTIRVKEATTIEQQVLSCDRTREHSVALISVALARDRYRRFSRNFNALHERKRERERERERVRERETSLYSTKKFLVARVHEFTFVAFLRFSALAVLHKQNTWRKNLSVDVIAVRRIVLCETGCPLLKLLVPRFQCLLYRCFISFRALRFGNLRFI